MNAALGEETQNSALTWNSSRISPGRTLATLESISMQTYNPHYELPKTVASARDSWQGTCQNGAVVSGLLAAVGAQLLGTFQNVNGDAGLKEFLIATCYATILLNICATVCSFIIIDRLGRIGFVAAAIRDPENDRQMGKIPTSQDKLLMKFGGSNHLSAMLFYCLITNYLGIVTLIIAILTYVTMVASKPTKIVISLIVAFTLLPTTYFIFMEPLFEPSKWVPTSVPREIEMEERDSVASSSTAPPMLEHSVGYISITMPQPHDAVVDSQDEVGAATSDPMTLCTKQVLDL